MTVASICPLPPKWCLALCPRPAHPSERAGPLASAVLCHRQSPPPPRVIWSLQPPWELECLMFPRLQARPRDTSQLRLPAWKRTCRCASLAGGRAGVSGVGWGMAGASGMWSTPRGCMALVQSGSYLQLLCGEGRVAQLREPGPPRGLQGPGAGRLPAQRGGERASLGPRAPAGSSTSFHRGTTGSSPRPSSGRSPCSPEPGPSSPFLTELGALEGAVGGWGVEWSPTHPSVHTHTALQEGGRRPSWSPDPAARLTPLLQIRERLGVSLGERPPTLVPVTHVMMCMNCGCDFSLTLRRHHCHACGKVRHGDVRAGLGTRGASSGCCGSGPGWGVKLIHLLLMPSHQGSKPRPVPLHHPAPRRKL